MSQEKQVREMLEIEGDRKRERTYPGEAVRFREAEENLLQEKSHRLVIFPKSCLALWKLKRRAPSTI